MNLSDQGDMFTETSFGENVGEIKEESSVIDLDLGVRKLSVSPTPYESSCVGPDGSSVSMLELHFSDDDLLSAFGSISVAERLEPRDDAATGSTVADAFDSIAQVDLFGERRDEGKDTSKFGSSGLASIAEQSTQRDGEAEMLVGIDKTCKANHPLIVYTSSQRRSARNTKMNQNNDSRKPSKCRRIAMKDSVLDINSLRILRRSRSSSSKRARSSVWGCMGNILPFEENGGLYLNLGNEEKLNKEKLRRARGGKGKRNAVRNQNDPKSCSKSCTPTGHISLKVKIGNKFCSVGNANEESVASGKDIPELFDKTETKLREKVSRDMVSPCETHMEKLTSSDTSALGTHLGVRGAFDNPSYNTSSDFHRIIYLEGGDNLGAHSENQFSDIGTSPDSEVINSVPDALLCEKGLPSIQDSSIMSKTCVSPSDISSSILSQTKSKKGKKKDEAIRVDNCTFESMPTGAEPTNNANLPVSVGDVSILSLPKSKSKKGKKKEMLHEAGDCRVERKLPGAETTNSSEVPVDLEVGQKVGDVSCCSDASMIATTKPHLNGAEMDPCSGLDAEIVSSNSQVCDTLIPCSNQRKFPKCSRAKGGSQGRFRILNLSREKDKASKKKANKRDVGGKVQVNEKVGATGVVSRMESLLAAGNQIPSGLGETGALSKDGTEPIKRLQFSSVGVREQYLPPRNAWVLCDECQKWRRILATLADQIEETNCGWTCKDNMDRDFANCSIPQEKSDSEINEELEISDASCEEDACGSFQKSNQSRSKVAQQSSWSLIKSNLFLHRSRKTQTIDEVMVCHCKPPSDGRMGCGSKCLNRMLNIECVQGTCPCGELCSNQQFQKRKYAKLKWFRCGKKGYGLQALDDISERQFLIEYVGEVLDVHSYEERQREYALNGHKHFYFMTLNGSEVIDACAKGNLGRFINHSCDPNCRTEKWMVNGEVCVGLFSLRDIKKGEEITFDYNYVRVFGAAAKKCVCGSLNCRGYIGGDLTNSEVIVQDDSDDEYTEPVMVCGDREMNGDWTNIMSNFLNDGENEIANEPPENRYSMKRHISARGESVRETHTSEALTQESGGVNSSQNAETMALNRFEVNDRFGNDSVANAVEQLDISLQSDGIVNKAMSSAHESVYATASSSKSLSDTVESKRKMKFASLGGKDEPAKSNSLSKTNRSSSSVKNGKPKMNVLSDKRTPDMDKSNAELEKSKKLAELPLTSAFEAVEEKLNKLLDLEGGISKRKDASRGYLKLLFLTATSGNNGHGEAIQSNRDLSMILGALLKTKSRSVLVDIINKNGLQMLHNIMKQYRKEFIKTPILRKLLKALEYLAMREILTLEHITGGSPRPGVESFKDSILTLTEHADKQVHQIARNFRDRWIPRSLRKNFCIERDDERTEFNQRPGCGGLSVSYDHCSDRGQKPSEAINSCGTQLVAGTVETSTQDLPSASGSSSCGSGGIRTRKRKSRWDNPLEENPHSRSRTHLAGDENLNIDEDIPPGFSSPCNGPILPSDAPSAAIDHQEREMHVKKKQPFNAILGDSQSRFVSSMPVSYGVPYSVVQQFGVLKAEASRSWTIAPGVPFNPFPPLPPPRSASSLSEHREKAEQCSESCFTYHTGQNSTRTCSVDPPEKNASDANGRPDFQQGGSYSLGRKYFRQQKLNNIKLAPPWVRMRNSWGYAGINSRNGLPG